MTELDALSFSSGEAHWDPRKNKSLSLLLSHSTSAHTLLRCAHALTDNPAQPTSLSHLVTSVCGASPEPRQQSHASDPFRVGLSFKKTPNS